MPEYSHWPPELKAARETLEQALPGSDAAQELEAKVAFLQTVAGQVFPEEVIPELMAYLKQQGFHVGDPRSA